MRNVRDNITNQVLLQIREQVCGAVWIQAKEVSDQVEGKVNGENLSPLAHIHRDICPVVKNPELRQIWIEVYLKGHHLIDQITGQLGEITWVRHKLIEQLVQEKSFKLTQ